MLRRIAEHAATGDLAQRARAARGHRAGPPDVSSDGVLHPLAASGDLLPGVPAHRLADGDRQRPGRSGLRGPGRDRDPRPGLAPGPRGAQQRRRRQRSPGARPGRNRPRPVPRRPARTHRHLAEKHASDARRHAPRRGGGPDIGRWWRHAPAGGLSTARRLDHRRRTTGHRPVGPHGRARSAPAPSRAARRAAPGRDRHSPAQRPARPPTGTVRGEDRHTRHRPDRAGGVPARRGRAGKLPHGLWLRSPLPGTVPRWRWSGWRSGMRGCTTTSTPYGPARPPPHPCRADRAAPRTPGTDHSSPSRERPRP